MFEKKTEPVPVYTVDMVPEPYELVGLVSGIVKSRTISEEALKPLGKEGAKIGADAVIGLRFIVNRGDTNFAYGTAIKYKG